MLASIKGALGGAAAAEEVAPPFCHTIFISLKPTDIIVLCCLLDAREILRKHTSSGLFVGICESPISILDFRLNIELRVLAMRMALSDAHSHHISV